MWQAREQSVLDEYEAITGDAFEAAAAAVGTDFSAWSEGEVRAFLEQRGEDYEDCRTFEALVSASRGPCCCAAAALVELEAGGCVWAAWAAAQHAAHLCCPGPPSSVQVQRARECETNTGPARRPDAAAAAAAQQQADGGAAGAAAGGADGGAAGAAAAEEEEDPLDAFMAEIGKMEAEPSAPKVGLHSCCGGGLPRCRPTAATAQPQPCTSLQRLPLFLVLAAPRGAHGGRRHG